MAANDYAASDDDYGGYNYYDPFLSFTASTAGTYYLGVSGYANESNDPSVADSGTSGSTGEYELTLLAEDASFPLLDFSSTSVTANENGGSVDFTVTLSSASADTMTVDYATSDLTATAGADYTAASGTLSFNPGETSKTVTVFTTDVTVAFDPSYSGPFTLIDPGNVTGDEDVELTDQIVAKFQSTTPKHIGGLHGATVYWGDGYVVRREDRKHRW